MNHKISGSFKTTLAINTVSNYKVLDPNEGMIKKSIPLLFLFLSILSKLEAQELKGKVVDSDTRDPIASVHIYNLTADNGLVSDKNGYFVIKVNINDTLFFQHLGFQAVQLIVNEKNLNVENTIYLHDSTVTLPEITIQEKRLQLLQNQKKQKMQIPGLPSVSETEPIEPMTGKWGNDQNNEKNFARVAGLHYTIYGPFSYFSRKEKEKRKFRKAKSKMPATAISEEFRKDIKSAFLISEEKLNQLIIQFNTKNPDFSRLEQNELEGLFLVFVSEWYNGEK